MAHRDRRAADARRCEPVERRGGADHVDDRVDRADLVELDVLDGLAVQLRLGAREPVEDVERAAPRAFGQLRVLDRRADVRVVVVRVVRVVLVVVVVVVVIVEHVPGGVDGDVRRRDAVLDHALDLQALAARPDGIERVADHVDRHAEVDQRAEHHVAGGAARAVDVEVQALHRFTSRAIFTAATAAPTPLSMLTTVVPGTQPESSEPSATSPSSDTP